MGLYKKKSEIIDSSLCMYLYTGNTFFCFLEYYKRGRSEYCNSRYKNVDAGIVIWKWHYYSFSEMEFSYYRGNMVSSCYVLGGCYI